MKSETFQNFQCWNTERISQVIRKEATNVDTATFMATHTPLSKLNYQTYLQQITDATEEGLFRELQRCAENDIHVFMAIHGVPGSGKSHLIRWLKERFEAINDDTECIIFIERSQCSLRNTLEQIIKSGVFQEMMMQKQLEKLENAKGELSKEGFALQLLNQFFVEGIEASLQDQIRPPTWLNKEKLEAFICDLNVRKKLLKAGGPIDRIVQFLTGGMEASRSSEAPVFYESDFDFLSSNSYSENAGYPPAREIVKQLQFGKSRQALARYFNQLLPHVIGHATTLTSDDFKRIFLDLRRELRNHGRNLSLFIEDVTALTGINLGLLDVLVAQHVGDINQNLCRVISILGITNSYFSDHFPDHMKDRLTHRITLNAAEDMRNISDTEILTNEDATAEMAARYLNAIRLQSEEIQEWSLAGNKPEFLPNACDRCPVKETCHQAFGYQRIILSPETELHLGFYPFNKTALWNFYQHIPEKRRTPRSFLHDVLFYIMQSHGEKIKSQQFPPALISLGGSFETFLLNKSSHRSLIENQGGLDGKRIETLVTIWGDGTIDAYEEDQTLFIGSLPTAVFIAFGIDPIEGERLNNTVHRPETRLSTLSVRVQEHALLENSSSDAASPPTLFPQKDLQSLQDDGLRLHSKYIVNWHNGAKLQDHEYYIELLIPLIRDFIDWDFYEISNAQFSEVLGRKYIYIEDQDGRKPSYALTFKRSTELRDMLQALVEIKESGQLLAGEELGAHISSMSIWLHRHEEEIVRFVRQPNHESTNVLPFVTVLILDCLLIACLAGELDSSKSSSTDLFRDLLRFCKNTTASSWDIYKQLGAKSRSTSWVSLMRRFDSSLVGKLCSLLPRILNCNQGTSQEVLFVDAATALSVLETFQLADWQLPPSGCVGKPLRDLWKDALLAYDNFYTHFKVLVQDERQAIQKLITELDNFIGNASAEEVFQAIGNMLQTLRDSQRGTKFTIDKSLNANNLNTLLTFLRDLVTEQNFAKFTMRLSQAGSQVASAREYIEYFSSFEKEAQLQRQKAKQQLMSQKDFTQEISQTRELVITTYQEIIGKMETLTMKEDAL